MTASGQLLRLVLELVPLALEPAAQRPLRVDQVELLVLGLAQRERVELDVRLLVRVLSWRRREAKGGVRIGSVSSVSTETDMNE